MTLRSTGLVVAAIFAAPVVAGAQGEASRPAVYVALPVSEGFTDATHALVETQALIRESLKATDIHVVASQDEADVVLTVLGRGRGDVELTAALQALDSAVNATPVPIATTERYIEATLTVGSCVEPGIEERVKPRSCYKRAFVGLGLTGRDLQRPAKRPPSNSWEACSDALVRDIRAWIMENATRILALR
jgi:hypothetical protein